MCKDKVEMNLSWNSPTDRTLPFSGAEKLFPGWKQSLAQTGLGTEIETTYRHGIEAYSAFCRRKRVSVAVETARQFMDETAKLQQVSVATMEAWKAALNWFFRSAREGNGPALRGVPTLGRVDLGKTDWERQLIARIRELHYSWRTEQTYRGWAWRYSEFLGHRGKQIEEGGTKGVKGFLSELAVKWRVSVATHNRAFPLPDDGLLVGGQQNRAATRP